MRPHPRNAEAALRRECLFKRPALTLKKEKGRSYRLVLADVFAVAVGNAQVKKKSNSSIIPLTQEQNKKTKDAESVNEGPRTFGAPAVRKILAAVIRSTSSTIESSNKYEAIRVLYLRSSTAIVTWLQD